MSQLQTFEHELEKIIGRPSTQRPFVCDGSPLTCGVFLVGFNPATTMDAGFWDFWKDGVGFDRDAWFEAYKIERAERPLRPGKTRRNPVSNSRRVIDWIGQAAAPVRILETNIHSLPSDDKASLASRDRQTRVFEFLLRSIRPKIVVAHGDDAGREIDRLAPEADVMKVKHFSRGWSQEVAEKFGAELALRKS